METILIWLLRLGIVAGVGLLAYMFFWYCDIQTQKNRQNN